MPDVLRRGDELRQEQRAATHEASQLEDAAVGLPEEQIVIEEAGVDRLGQEEGVALDVAVDEHHRNAVGVEHAWPWNWC